MSEMPESGSKPAIKSLLTSLQRRWLSVAMFLAALLLANTLYLLTNRFASVLPGQAAAQFADGRESISKIFQVMVLSHTGLGFIVVGLLLVFALWHLPRVWKRHRSQTVTTGLLFVGSGLVLAATGPFIMYAAASRQHSWVWWTHVVAGAVVPVSYILHRSVSFVRPRSGAYARFATAWMVAFAVMVVGHSMSQRDIELTREAMLARSKGMNTGPGSRQRDLRDYVDGPYVPPGFVPPGSPFFPSAATTTTGDYLPSRILTRGDIAGVEKMAPDLDNIGFVVNQRIGADTCERCHPDAVEQWSKSAHRFASFNNPFYEATILDMRRTALAMTDEVAEHMETYKQWKGRTGEIKSKWCSGCHDPALMLAGKMTDDINRRTAQAQAGLTCLACHAIDSIHNITGNGNYNIADEQEDPYLFANAGTGTVGAFLHDTAIKAKPTVHKREMLKPVFHKSEFCAPCHKVSLPQSVNNYRWLRGQDDFDNWNDSGVALNATRTFYLPPKKRECQACHMPLEPAPLGDVAANNGMIHSHRFLAVNTALPFVRGDLETVERTEKFLYDKKLRIDIFALTREDGGKHAEALYPLDAIKPIVKPGETLMFDVVVRNMGVGHTFPGGTNDSNEGWVEFSVLDESGNVIEQSGGVGEDGYVDPEAHFFKALIVDRDGQPIHRRNAPDIYTVVYANLIGPGTAQVVHYRINVPPNAGSKLTLRARLLWRKFDRAYTEFAFRSNPNGFKRFDKCPDLPVTEICKSEITLPLVQHDAEYAEPVEANAADWMRFNDYGIGLLLQSDTKGAERAFEEVARLVPDRVDGPRNLARVALRDGDLPSAYKDLLRCEEMAPNDAQTAWFWGLLMQEDGRYIEAASAYRRVLQQFPGDRATWRNLGRTYFLDGKYESSIEAMNEVLRIDPEDRVAHYHIMLSERALQSEAKAKSAEIAYLRYKIDESAKEVTRAYRLDHPNDNLETQSIHIHALSSAADAVLSVAPDNKDNPNLRQATGPTTHSGGTEE